MDDFIYKKYKHNPPHLFVPNTKYLITGATYQRKHFLFNDDNKIALRNSKIKGFTDKGWVLEDWIILNNHYHLMANSPDNTSLLNFIIKDIHRFNALWLKKNISELKNEEILWYDYWDSCIAYEVSYYSRLNYIWFNQAKHGYVEFPDEWIHGSFYYRVKKEKEYLDSILEKYPCDKIKIDDRFQYCFLCNEQ
jgi:putative transposase